MSSNHNSADHSNSYYEHISSQLRNLQKTYKFPNHSLISECHIGMIAANAVCEDAYSVFVHAKNGSNETPHQPSSSSSNIMTAQRAATYANCSTGGTRATASSTLLNASSTLTTTTTPKPSPAPSTDLYCGVFDGHNGPACSSFLKQELASYVHYLLQRYPNENEWEHAMKCAFTNCDTVFLNEIILENVLHGSSLAECLAGSCASVVYISEQKQLLVVGNTGDCRVILGQVEHETPVNLETADWQTRTTQPTNRVLRNSPNTTNPSHSPKTHTKLTVRQITMDHTVGNQKERLRLIQEHPNEHNIIANERVKGFLEPTRSFGDAHYKIEALHNIVRQEYKLPPPHSFPYINAECEVFIHPLVPQRDRYIIMATDGLYELLSNAQIVSHVHSYFERRDGKKKLPSWCSKENVATFLIRKALARAFEPSVGKSANTSMNATVANSHLNGLHGQQQHHHQGDSDKYHHNYSQLHTCCNSGSDEHVSTSSSTSYNSSYENEEMSSSDEEISSKIRAESDTLKQVLFNVPRHQRRFLHDDLTVIVLVLKRQPQQLQQVLQNQQLQQASDFEFEANLPPPVPEYPASFSRWNAKREEWSNACHGKTQSNNTMNKHQYTYK